MKRKNVIILVLAVLLLISLLTACGSNVSFKIDFIVDGAVIHTIDTKGNEEIQLPADPEKEGYIFDGWFWDNGTFEKPFTANSLLDAPIQENMTVYAKWIPESEETVSPPTIPYTSLTIIPNVSNYNGGLYLMVGDTYAFNCNVAPSNGNETLTLKTDNPSIISVISRGNVLITGSGTANVYCESASGLRSNTCPIQCFNITAPEAPLTLNNWSDPAYLLTETVTFSTLDFSFSGEYGVMNNIKLNYNLVGTKTYCFDEGAYAFKVNFTIKNSHGVVIGSGTITTAAFSVGDTVQCSAYKSITLGDPLTGGDYSIELIGVRW